MNDTTLYFARLRAQNLLRCENAFHHKLSSWSVAEWGAATAGEVGEACNVAKKLLRFRDNVRGNPAGLTIEQLREHLAEELADAVIYLDLWAASQAINLGDAVRAKFNKTSAKLGSDIKL